jgi:peptidoglycan/xylan/chitin deacetylase (PgdA/CDA1 family)
MDVLDEHDMRAVFFFEPFGTRIVDPRPIEEAARLIVERGHDVELHVHPEFRIDLDDARAAGKTPSGLLRHYSVAEQRAMLREGADLIEGWTGYRPIAFRAGSFGLDHAGSGAVLDEGFEVDSSYNLWAIDEGISGFSREPPLNDVALLPNGLLEVPTTNLLAKGVRGGLRNFELSSLSTTEMVAVIEAMWSGGARTITSLTHSFRLLKTTSVQYRDARLDPINLHRLRALARYLAEHRDRIRVSTFRDLPLERWRSELGAPPATAAFASPPAWASAARLAVQAIKDRGAV